VAVTPTEQPVAALFVSVGLHAALLLVPAFVVLGRSPTPSPPLPNSVAMLGNSIEVEAPTAELAPAPASPAPEPEPEAARPAPVDVKSLPTEPDRAPAAPPPPRPRATPRPRPRPAAPASPPVAAGDASSTGTPSPGTFGQEGLAPGVRRLGYAFTRAIPAVTPSDAAWRELPTGHVGTIRIELSVDESNKLGPLKRWQARPGEPAPPAALERMVERTLILLRAGQFALSGSNQPGSERLVIDVHLRDEAPEEEATDDVVQKRFDGASPGHAGSAYFRYGTGRAFEAKVTIAASGK
jgi:hypothetical protein